MKKMRISLLATFLVIVFCAVSGTIVSADTKIKFNKKNFPNEFLRQEIYNSVDVNEDGYLSKNEINTTEELEINMYRLGTNHEDGCIDCGTSYSKEEWAKYCIFDCKGLEYFKNLKELKISVYTDYYDLGIKCRIKNLDKLNKLTKLEKLTLTGDKVTEKLDLSKLKNLKKLDVGFYNLKKINVNGLKKLKDLSISQSKIKKIDVSENKNLKDIYINSKNLKNIDLSTNKNLEEIMIWSDKLKKLDLSNNKKLTYVSTITPKLKNINLKGCKKIKQFSIEGIYKKIDLSTNTSLKKIWFYSSKLEKIILPKKNKIRWIYLDETPVKNINVSRLNPKTLTVLNLPCTNIEKLDISKLTGLKMLRVPDSTDVIKAEGQKAKVVRCGETYSEYIAKYGK